MKIPRFRIGSIMVLVALAALNFGVIRLVSGFRVASRLLLTTGVLPMANVLVVGLLIGSRYPGSRRFLLGFEAFGGTALAFALAGATLFPGELSINYLHLVLIPYRDTFGPNLTRETAGRHLWFVLGFYAIDVVMLDLPQLAFALLGGFLSRKLTDLKGR
jgi:hypothetical protein